MKNQDVAAALYEIADLQEMLSIQWKPIAFRRAARTIETLKEDIDSIYKKDGIAGLQELPGIGEGIAKKVAQFLDEGRIDEFESLKKKVPKGVEEMIHIPGLGPKKAVRLAKELRIKGIDQLESAAKAGKIRNLEGFGEKSEQEMLKGISLVRQGTARKLLAEVLPLAQEFEQRLKRFGAAQVVVAGSLRRRKETVADIDLLVISKQPRKIMDYFCSMPEVQDIVAKGETKTTVRLEGNLQADVRVLEQKSFGAALQYFTGSKEHNVKLRQIAINKGMKLN